MQYTRRRKGNRKCLSCRTRPTRKLCHDPGVNFNIKPGKDEPVLKVEDPRITRRWLPRARFSHEVHLVLACVECHALADPEAAAVSFAPSGPDHPVDRMQWPQRTREEMLPSIRVCRRCHSPEALASSPGRDQSAHPGCALCRRYHEPSISPNEGGALPPAAMSSTASEDGQTD